MRIETQKTLDDWGISKLSFDWTSYNRSQTQEKTLFLKLLHDLCNITEGDTYLGKGRKSRPAPHMIFCMGLKVYENKGSRTLTSDLSLCRQNLYLDFVPHFNSVSNYFNSNLLKHHLQYLITLSSLPLAQLEDKFAIDSTGFSERKYLERWSTIRQKFSKHQQYKKAHCIYGVYSNIIPQVIITDGKSNDSPQFIKLLEKTAENFNIKEITADMAYSSRDNLQYAHELGITPFIPFKKNATGKTRGSPIWNKMYLFFKNNREEFMKHYHVRSNAESGFFMIKQKFGDSLSYKTSIAQTNEILCKVLCHNIRVLIQEMFLSNLKIDFNSCARLYSAQQ